MTKTVIAITINCSVVQKPDEKDLAMVRPKIPEEEKKSSYLMVRVSKEDLEVIQNSLREIKNSLIVLRRLGDEKAYPSGKTADVIKTAILKYSASLREELLTTLNK